MKQLFVFSILLISSALYAQDKNKTTNDNQKPTNQVTQENQNVNLTQTGTETPVNPRTASTAVKLESHPTAPLPYNVDDKYMGRAEEFKKLFKANELPADFPIYEKQYGWTLKEYDAVVGAYLENNKPLLSEAVLKKLEKTK